MDYRKCAYVEKKERGEPARASLGQEETGQM